MKTLVIGLTLLTSVTTYAYDCGSELKKNTASTQEISQIGNITEAERSILLEMNANARQSIELACGLRSANKVDPIFKVEEARLQILDLQDISEAERSILLEMNTNARKAVELSLKN
ncbi:MAG: hypothetical protein HOP07_15795 [Bacteriovoracaceae bacterium]|nr:hypothetical protein [Bacteriovoracaceae bacterium]